VERTSASSFAVYSDGLRGWPKPLTLERWAARASVKYEDGREVRLWDRVQPWLGCRAIVVFSIDAGEYSPEFPKEHWEYLERGIMLDTEHAGLVHMSEPDEDLVLISRGGPPAEAEIAQLREAQARARQQKS
jgi:hypothetical protein